MQVLKELKKKSKSAYVFAVDGKLPTKRGVQSRFRAALKRAGIKDFRFHDLRHTFASHLVMNRADLKTVQELLGHKTFSMTLRYAYLSSDHKRKAVENLAEKMQKRNIISRESS